MTRLDKKVADTELLSLEVKGFYFVYKHLLEFYGKDEYSIVEAIKHDSGLSEIRILEFATYIDDFQNNFVHSIDTPDNEWELIDIEWFINAFKENDSLKKAIIEKIAEEISYEKIIADLKRYKICEYDYRLHRSMWIYFIRLKREGKYYILTMEYDGKIWCKSRFKILSKICKEVFLKNLVLC